MAEAAASFRPLYEQAGRSEGVIGGPADALNWNLGIGTLVSAVTDQLRRCDDIPFRLLIDSAPSQAEQLLRRNPSLQDEDRIAADEAAEAALGALLSTDSLPWLPGESPWIDGKSWIQLLMR